MKRFLLWLCESEHNSTLIQKKIEKLRINNPTPLKTANDILTADELASILNATKNLRDRALLEVLYESMGRINEVATLKWEQIQFHKDYATVTLQSKTDSPRKVPLHTSHISLRHWMDRFPGGATPEKYIFTPFYSKGLRVIKYETVRVIINTARIDAGITKKVSPHILRHTRITDLMRMGVAEQTIKMIAWGTVTTEMLRVYAHLTPTDAENELNRVMGITTSERTAALPSIATPVPCPECGLVHPKTDNFCKECGTPLSDEMQEKQDTLVKALKAHGIYDDIVKLLEGKKKEGE